MPEVTFSPRQRGLSLIFSLLALVAMTLGAVALVRSVDTSVLALGNLSYKQSGVSAATRSTEDAIAWIANNINGPAVLADAAAQGYYATSLATLDSTGRAAGSDLVLARVDWENDGCLVNGEAVAAAACITAGPKSTYGANEVRFVITRLCNAPGAPTTSGCARPPIPGKVLTNNAGGECQELAAPCSNATVEMSPYFRIIVRARGPRGTVSFTETLVHF